MPLRGETIGAAYIKLLIDGSGLPEDIKQELRDNEPIMTAQGQRDSKSYREGFDTGIKDSKRDFRKTLNEAVGLSDAIEQELAGPKWQGLQTDLKKKFGDVGVLIGASLTEHVRDAGGFQGVADELTNIGALTRRAQEEIDSAARSATDELQRMSSIQRDVGNHMDSLVRDFRRLHQTADEVGQSTERAGSRLGRLFTSSKSLSDRLEKDAKNIGKVFGKGSRNNAVNFFGSVVGGLVSVVGAAPRAVAEVGKFFEKMRTGLASVQTAFKSAGGGFSGLISGASAGASAFGPLLAALPIAAIAAGALIQILGPLAALLSGVAAAVTALASAIAFGLIGAMIPLLGLVTPLIVSVGVLALAFSKLSKTAKKTLAKDLHPLTLELGKLRDAASGGLFGNVHDQAKRLAPVIALLRPLVHGTAEAMSHVFDGFITALRSKGFQSFIKTMEVFVPQVIKSLGNDIKNVFAGFGGIFLAAIPVTKEFLHWLSGVTGEFAKLDTPQGKKGLEGFFNRAADSAKRLFTLAGAIGQLLIAALNPGQATGNDIITSLINTFNSWTADLKANPHALSEWFANGKSIAIDLGNIVVGLGHIFQTLDSPTNRRTAHDALVAIATGVQLAADAFTIADQQVRNFIDIASSIGKFVLPVLKLFVLAFIGIIGGIVHAAAVAFGWIPGIGPKLRAADKEFDDFARKANIALGNIQSPTVKVKFQAELDASLRKIIGNPKLAQSLHGTFVPVTAGGGIFSGAQTRLIAEAGSEAVVPLERPLSQVDPAVRALSAFAQGLSIPQQGSNGAGSGRTIDASGWTIVSPSEDPRAVARETLNQLASTALF